MIEGGHQYQWLTTYDRELAKACLLPANFDPLYLVAVGPVAGT